MTSAAPNTKRLRRRSALRTPHSALPSPRPTRRRLLLETLENRSLLAALPAAAFAPGEILIGFEGDIAQQFRQEGPGRALQSAAARYGGFGLQDGELLMQNGGPLGQPRAITLWTLPPGKDAAAVAGQLSKLPGVAYAEPNYLVSADATPVFPNDPKFSNLWGMHNAGASGGTIDADIDAPEAWGVHTGGGNVVVAVIDTGVNYNHADLKFNMWTNPFDPPDGVDNDLNGFTDDVYGADFVNNDGDPKDDNGHGTHVAGTIGATGNNGTGVVGVAWDVQIMGLKFLNSSGSGTTADAIRAVDYATKMRNKGVNLVLTSNSWGGGGFSQGLYDAINASRTADMLFVAAAGNNGGSSASYPALYNLDNIISVAATDRNDQLASFSNRGVGVDIAAPGVDVYSTYRNSYSTLSGTSMATPHVAGAAALVADYLNSQQGSLPSYQAVRDAILNSGDHIAATETTVSSGSRLNAHKALLHAAVLAGQATGISIADASVLEGDAGNTTVTLTVERSGRTDTTTTVSWATANGSAIAGSDYVAGGDQLVFGPGETTQQFSVTIVGDAVMEPDEAFKVVLSNPTNVPSSIGAVLLRSQAAATIKNDEFGLVSHWTADDTAADLVSGNDGELVSGATYSAGHVGQAAFSFDGVDDRVIVADSESLKLTRSLTIEGWIKVNAISPTTGGVILFRGDDRGGLDPYALSVNTNGSLRFLVTPESNSGASIGTPAPVGEFFHVAATLDDATGQMRLYVNGGLTSEIITTARPFRDLDPTRNPGIGIGNHGGYPTTPHNFPFNGLIDELKVYNYALSPTDVLAHFNADKGSLPEPSISIDDVTVVEGQDSSAVFTVSLSKPWGAAVSVNFETKNGTATAADGDYTPTSDTVTFAPGETKKTIPIQIVNNDGFDLAQETFSVVLLSASGANIADGEGVATILQGLEVVTYANTSPKPVRDVATTTSTINVPDSFTVLDLDVKLNITHTWDSDLKVSLISPDGTRVQLFRGVGADGDNFTNTILDDEAALPITAGTAPFTGSFRPQGLLSSFDGKSAVGTWTLEITDEFRGDKGTLNSWSLMFTRAAGSMPSSATSSLALDSATDGAQGVSALDAVAVDQLLSDLDERWTRKSRVKLVV